MTHILHPLVPQDAATMQQMRIALAGAKGTVTEPEARPKFDDLMASVPPADGVTYSQATIGGVPGWWICPADDPAEGTAILYLHGGAYVIGSATAYRTFVGQIVARAGLPAFVADYRLAPEHPFPAAVEDAERAWRGLVAEGYGCLALAGDSAGGGLALSLLSILRDAVPAPLAAVALSPWTDLALQSETMQTRDAVDALSSASALAATARLYLGDHDPADPLASPVHSDRTRLPPVLIHTGEDEVLLDDILRYAEGAPNVEAHVWTGMIHVFPSSVGALAAAGEALDHTGAFIRSHLAKLPSSEESAA